MELRDYLHFKRITLKDFASMCGFSRGHFHRILNAGGRPGPKLVRKIEEVTKGEVTRYDLLKEFKDDIDKV